MNANKTSLGEIMNLLDISLSELSEYLHIDRTTISKWRSGARRLLPQSPYFDKLVSYFVKRNNQMIHKPLFIFLSNLYPETDFNNEEQTYTFLKTYLCAQHSEDTLYQVESGENIISRQLFIGVEGRRKAINFILDEADKLAAPCTIKILESEQMSWFCRDTAYMKKTIARLKHLADRNFKIEFAYSSMQNHPCFLSFMAAMETIRFHKNTNKYVVDVDRIQGLIPCIYLLSGRYVAVGLDYTELVVPIHSNLFEDSYNLYKYEKLFDRVLQAYANRVLITDSGIEINQILSTINHLRLKKEELMFYGDQLSVTTMNESLLIEILDDNYIKGSAKERCIYYYRSLRQSMETTLQNCMGGYNLNLTTLERALSHRYIIEYELSALTDQQIRKTPEQYRRHLHETVEFLESHDHVKMSLSTNEEPYHTSCSWVKRNLWCLSLNTSCVPHEYQVGFWDDLYLVNSIMDSCNNLAKENSPAEYRKKEYNLKVLTALSRGETA